MEGTFLCFWLVTCVWGDSFSSIYSVHNVICVILVRAISMFHFQDNSFQSGFISTPEPVAQSTDTWRRKGIRTQVPQFFKITSLTLDFHELLLDSGSALLRRYPIISPLHCKSTWSKDEVNSKNLRAPEGLWGALGIEEWNYEQCTCRCKIVNDLHITHWQETLELSLACVWPLNRFVHSTGISKRGDLIPSI